MMTAEDAALLVRARAESVQLRGHGLHVKDVAEGPPGYFRPPDAIDLLEGRMPLQTLFTLLHEIGHFWSFTVERRGSQYGGDVVLWRGWTKEIGRRIMKRPDMQHYANGGDVPRETWDRSFREEALKLSCPLDRTRRGLILDEEARAWTLAYAIVEVVVPDLQQELVAEARRALEPYFVGLGLPSDANWVPNVVELRLSPEDRCYISELAMPGQYGVRPRGTA